MKTNGVSEELAAALESLRNRRIVAESRDYARRWERAGMRADRLRSRVFGPMGGIVAVSVILCGMIALGRGQLAAGWRTTLHLSAGTLIETPIGETRVLVLDDGSRVLLDRSSQLRVSFSPASRDVELLAGEAQFEVAKNIHRPFRVRTPSAEVVAVGTVFDVAALPVRTTVTLIEGRVQVRSIVGAPKTTSQVEALTPGQQLGIANDGQLLGKKAVKVTSVTAWQRGMIVLDDMPLADALSVINRYSKTQILIEDSRLQARRISGVFRIGDVDTAALTFRLYFGLSERSRSERTITLGRGSGA